MGLLCALVVAAAALVIGAAVGATGVGGVLLVPALAALLFARNAVDWRMALPLSAGGLVFAFAGATLGAQLPATALAKLLGAVMALGCAYAFFAPRSSIRMRSGGRAIVLFAVGLLSGLAAGLTGAGGPLVAVPLMSALGFPFLATVAASQVLQLVAGASGAAAYWRDGAVAGSLLVLIVPLQLAGIGAGVRLAHRLDVQLARRVLAGLGVLVGGALLVL